MKKERKPRGRKLNGEKSYNLCPYCYARGCNPLGRSRKIEERLTKGLCPACGHADCTCKSSILSPEKWKEREKNRKRNYEKRKGGKGTND